MRPQVLLHSIISHITPRTFFATLIAVSGFLGGLLDWSESMIPQPWATISAVNLSAWLPSSTSSLVSPCVSSAHQQWPRLAHFILIEAKAVMEPIAQAFNKDFCIQGLDHTGSQWNWRVLVQVAGWAYFAAWSLSFYPQAGLPLLILKAVLMWLVHGSQVHAISCKTASWSRASSACWVQTHLHRHLHRQNLPSTSWVLLG